MESLYTKLKKQVSEKFADGLELIKRSSSAASGRHTDLSFDQNSQRDGILNRTGDLNLNNSQVSFKSGGANQSFTQSESMLDFGQGPPAIHGGVAPHYLK